LLFLGAVKAYAIAEIATNITVGITMNVKTVSKTDKPGADVAGPSKIVMG
jgi:hypothetical protein